MTLCHTIWRDDVPNKVVNLLIYETNRAFFPPPASLHIVIFVFRNVPLSDNKLLGTEMHGDERGMVLSD